jgi:FkbM family methyltransferase
MKEKFRNKTHGKGLLNKRNRKINNKRKKRNKIAEKIRGFSIFQVLKSIIIIFLIFCYIFFFKLEKISIIPFTIQEEELLNKKLLKFKSYSQYLEDLVLFILLFDIKEGFYIDVGAFEPSSLSVTKAFHLRGWKGINIEPQQKRIQQFEKHRPNDINLQIAVGPNEGNVTFYIKEAASTINPNYSSLAKEIVNLTMDTMSNICRKYVPPEKKIDFCKIDVEGGEKGVLLGYDFKNYRPKVFCIESTVPGRHKNNHYLWEDILIKNGFTFVYQQEINRFYVDNNCPKILARGQNISQFIQKYKKK